ncbi:hypothetical protein AV274_2233 [Blastocystis sp. ATCC 50177/Nand II]|uniref:Uncharacterized protein n=1 Tax=Blastocystis sp. subtype 1 (strain ATCC 50177 / NandII) TaxID=478820 RepID=A0A196SIP0_BLAHN|nr:hypothetical protein AV274_2233 [Blastocystis sp. ATCC 50177/Nand II]
MFLTLIPIHMKIGEKELRGGLCHYFSYAVFRRSMRNPFFHPYFYDYGGDKMELFHRLHMIGGYRMYVLSTDFGFNIPHKVTKMAEEYKLGKDEEPMFIQYEIFTHLFKNWDKGYHLYNRKRKASSPPNPSVSVL